jgi:hypothetical protein
MAVHLLHAVTGTLALEAMPLHDTSGTATLARANDVNAVDTIKKIDCKNLTDLKAVRRAAELFNKSLRLAVRLWRSLNTSLTAATSPLAIEDGNLPATGAAYKAAGTITKPDLNSLVAIPIERPKKKN